MTVWISGLAAKDFAGPLIGFLGDAITFTGALIMALKEAGEEKRARELRAVVAVFEKSKGMQRLERVTIEGIPIETERDIELALLKRASRRARIGAIFLSIGFMFLGLCRWIEIKDVFNHLK